MFVFIYVFVCVYTYIYIYTLCTKLFSSRKELHIYIYTLCVQNLNLLIAFVLTNDYSDIINFSPLQLSIFKDVYLFISKISIVIYKITLFIQ